MKTRRRKMSVYEIGIEVDGMWSVGLGKKM